MHVTFCISSTAACNVADGICSLHWRLCLLVCNVHSIEAPPTDLNHSQHLGVTIYLGRSTSQHRSRIAAAVIDMSALW